MIKKSALIKDKPSKKPLSDREIQLALIENFVNMQKVLTNLTIKFDLLSENISRLLQLFEISAKSFVKKTEDGTIAPPEDKDLIKKLDTLLDQNKTVAKGLTLIEEKIRHRIYPEHGSLEHSEEISGRPRPKPLPRI